MADPIDHSIEEILPDGKLPGDIMVSILLKLPVKSLLRFKAVSKAWRSLISSTSFIKTHLHGKSVTADTILIAMSRFGGDEYALLTTDYYKNHAADDNVSLSEIPRSFPTKEKEAIRILDSCNGLVCLGRFRYSESTSIILWNPATRRYWSVDSPLKSLFVVGLGYVEAKDDYKIVVLTEPYNSNSRMDMYVHALGSGSWKKLDHDCSGFYFQFSSPSFVNGRMHWLNFSGGCKTLISAFDLLDEVMCHSSVPDNYGSSSEIFRELLVIRGCLAVVVFHVSQVMDPEVWVMTEYGVPESWAKQFTISGLPNGPYQLRQPPLSWKDGELLFRCHDQDVQKLMPYDPVGGKKQDDALFKARSLFQVFSYVESLVSFDGDQRCNHSIC